jgi:hypothetical protein
VLILTNNLNYKKILGFWLSRFLTVRICDCQGIISTGIWVYRDFGVSIIDCRYYGCQDFVVNPIIIMLSEIFIERLFCNRFHMIVSITSVA